LPLRLRQHNENAIAVANFLKDRDDVSHVIFPGLQTGEFRRRADAYLKGGYGALIGFELKGGSRRGGGSSMR
jgi:O-acetylhomoserine (thiol)-lyase